MDFFEFRFINLRFLPAEQTAFVPPRRRFGPVRGPIVSEGPAFFPSRACVDVVPFPRLPPCWAAPTPWTKPPSRQERDFCPLLSQHLKHPLSPSFLIPTLVKLRWSLLRPNAFFARAFPRYFSLGTVTRVLPELVFVKRLFPPLAFIPQA